MNKPKGRENVYGRDGPLSKTSAEGQPERVAKRTLGGRSDDIGIRDRSLMK